MNVRSYPVGMIGTNCYLLMDDATRTCALVDPGDEGALLLTKVKESGYELKMLLLTHGHFDHVTAVPALLKEYPDLPVYVKEEDYEDVVTGGGFSRGTGPIASVVFYKEGDTVTLGGLTITVLETPGHTPGSVTLKVGDDTLFTGDTLFSGSCGRTDFPGGNYAQMMQSLARLGNLPGDYAVYPGHENATTLDKERKINYYMKEALSQYPQ